MIYILHKDTKKRICRGVTAQSAVERAIKNGRSLAGADLADYREKFDPAGIELCGLDLSGMDLRGAKLPGWNLTGINFNGADLRGTDFSHTTVDCSTFAGAKLEGAIFENTTLDRGCYVDADFSKVVWFTDGPKDRYEAPWWATPEEDEDEAKYGDGTEYWAR